MMWYLYPGKQKTVCLYDSNLIQVLNKNLDVFSKMFWL